MWQRPHRHPPGPEVRGRCLTTHSQRRIVVHHASIDERGGGVSAALTDFQLPLDAALAALPVVRLGGVVFRHHLHEFARQRGVLEGNRQMSVPPTSDCPANRIFEPYLRLAYSQVS